MRVIAGERRRYKLNTPKSMKIRPTSDMIKETLFNMIDPYIFGSVFVDLFAGTGQIGIEALSRGAENAIFIDRDREAVSLIKSNLEHTGYVEYSRIFQGNLPGTVGKLNSFDPDIIFMDPPFESGLYEGVFLELSKLSLKEDVLIIAESDIKEDFSFLDNLGFYIEKTKEYKSSKHVFVRGKNE